MLKNYIRKVGLTNGNCKETTTIEGLVISNKTLNLYQKPDRSKSSKPQLKSNRSQKQKSNAEITKRTYKLHEDVKF